jgi:hypothetical protein
LQESGKVRFTGVVNALSDFVYKILEAGVQTPLGDSNMFILLDTAMAFPEIVITVTEYKCPYLSTFSASCDVAADIAGLFNPSHPFWEGYLLLRPTSTCLNRLTREIIIMEARKG